jgi:hypothetical protein
MSKYFILLLAYFFLSHMLVFKIKGWILWSKILFLKYFSFKIIIKININHPLILKHLKTKINLILKIKIKPNLLFPPCLEEKHYSRTFFVE